MMQVTPPSYEAYRAQRVFSSLDGMRGICITAVVWHHASLPEWVARLPGASRGFLGVDLFFTISGFLIVTLILRERAERNAFSLKKFYARRSLRIFPLYYAVIAAGALYYCVLRPNGGLAPRFRSDVVYLLLYLTNWHHAGGLFGVTWSLSTEEQFYVVWPSLEKALGPRAIALVLAFALALSQAIQLGLINPLLQGWFGWSADEPAFLRETTFTPILLGVVLAHVLHSRRWYERVASSPWFGHRYAALAWSGVVVALLLGAPADIRGWARPTIQLAMCALLACVVVRDDHALRRILTVRPLMRVGALSYGIYLLHMVGLEIANVLLRFLHVPLPFGSLPLGGAITLLLAEVSFRGFEERFLRLKSKFSATPTSAV